MNINRYGYNIKSMSWEFISSEIEPYILTDLECAKEELEKLRSYYINTKSYEVSLIDNNEFEIINYQSRIEYIIRLDI